MATAEYIITCGGVKNRSRPTAACHCPSQAIPKINSKTPNSMIMATLSRRRLSRRSASRWDMSLDAAAKAGVRLVDAEDMNIPSVWLLCSAIRLFNCRDGTRRYPPRDYITTATPMQMLVGPWLNVSLDTSQASHVYSSQYKRIFESNEQEE